MVATIIVVHTQMTNVLQAFFALGLILPLIILSVYLLRRYSAPGKSTQTMKIIDRLAIGHREYILVVQIEQEKLVLGISPNAFSTLHILKNE